MPFSALEGELLMDARALGKSWAEIAEMLPFRNATMLRRHYATHLKHKVDPSFYCMWQK
jgi:hypothetical protein